MTSKPTVLCIVGPTATGKTALSVELAKKHDGEIVSADAVAVYRGLDIGSAKPTEAEKDGVPHHMIDCAEIRNDHFTVSTFREEARRSIDAILSRGRLPIVVGGSGLYVDSIFADMSFSAPSDPSLRTSLEQDYDTDKTAVFERLKSLDPTTAERLHPNDKKRVVRALEVCIVSGRSFSELNRSFETAQKSDETYRVVRVGLQMDREQLYRRIDARVDEMIRNGLVNEAFTLFEQGLTPDRYTAMQAIGYAQLYDVYRGVCDLSYAVDEIKHSTRRFAKRQITWFKRNREIVWFDVLRKERQIIIQEISELIKHDN